MEEKFLYFMERTEQDLAHIRKRVDKLWDFRLILIGGSAVVSAIVSFIVAMMGYHV